MAYVVVRGMQEAFKGTATLITQEKRLNARWIEDIAVCGILKDLSGQEECINYLFYQC